MSKLNNVFAAALTVCLASCAEESITETGFHENIPGFFNYYEESIRPCGSTDSEGLECSYSYDDSGRQSQENCPGLYVITTSYENNPLTRTEVIEGAIEGRDQTNVETVIVEDGFLMSKTIDRSYEAYPSDQTIYTYIRDESHRLNRIDTTGSSTGSQIFTYDEETSLVSKVKYVGTGTAAGDLFFPDLIMEYTWDDERLAEAKITYEDGAIEIFRYFYDQYGFPSGNERIRRDSSVVTTNYLYDCSDSEDS